MKKFLMVILTGIITSLFIFPFNLPFTSADVNTKMVIAAVGLVLFGYDLLRNRALVISRDFLIFSIIAIMVSVWTYLVITLNDTIDDSYVQYVISAWVWMGGAYTVVWLIKAVHGEASVKLIGQYLVCVCVGQCILAYSMTLSPALKNFVDSLMGNAADFMGQAEGRIYGLGAALDPNADRGPHALVITPTRELATQIDQVAQTVATQTGQVVTTVIGGERYEKQISRLARGCDMLVATPGRLIDLMEQDAVRLDHVRVLVLDEADRMLDMGFWPSVRRIVARLPRDRQTLLFSATISGDIERSIPSMVHEPVNVEIARVGQTADTVEERMVPVVQGQKVDLLTHLIETDRPGRVLVFCRTKQRVDAVAAALEHTGLSVGVMHADRRQRDRERALADFRAGTLTALVATDVMSRGIDVQDIDCVIHFDVPMDPEDYVHRIGRTGRAGESGIAFTFVAPDEISPLREIEYYTRKLIPLWEPPDYTFAQGRIVPNPKRSASRAQHSLFRGSRGGTRGPAGGRFGRHR